MSPEQNSPEKPRDRRAFNAYRHGLTGQVLVIAPADEQPYKDHCRGIHQSMAPVGGLEIDLVQQIADDRWRMKRAIRHRKRRPRPRTEPIPTTPSPATEQVDVALAQGRVWNEQKKDLNLLTLYENRIQRRIEKNIALVLQAPAGPPRGPPGNRRTGRYLRRNIRLSPRSPAPQFCLFQGPNPTPRRPPQTPRGSPQTGPEGRLNPSPTPNPHPNPRFSRPPRAKRV